MSRKKTHLFEREYEYFVALPENDGEACVTDSQPAGKILDWCYAQLKQGSQEGIRSVLIEFIDLCLEDPRFCSLDYLEFIVKSDYRMPKSDLYRIQPYMEAVDSFFTMSVREKAYKILEMNYPIYKYETDSNIGSTLVTLDYAFRNNLTIKRCSHCLRIFVANHKGQKYCKYKSLEYPGMYCADAGAYSARIGSERLLDDEYIRMQKLIKSKLTSMKKMIRYYEPDIILPEKPQRNIWINRLSEFKSENAKWQSRIALGESTTAECIIWLESLKKSGKEHK